MRPDAKRALDKAGAFETGLLLYRAISAVLFRTNKTKTAATFGGFGGSGLPSNLSPFHIAYDRINPLILSKDIGGIGATHLVAGTETPLGDGRPSVSPIKSAVWSYLASRP